MIEQHSQILLFELQRNTTCESDLWLVCNQYLALEHPISPGLKYVKIRQAHMQQSAVNESCRWGWCFRVQIARLQQLVLWWDPGHVCDTFGTCAIGGALSTGFLSSDKPTSAHAAVGSYGFMQMKLLGLASRREGVFWGSRLLCIAEASWKAWSDGLTRGRYLFLFQTAINEQQLFSPKTRRTSIRKSFVMIWEFESFSRLRRHRGRQTFWKVIFCIAHLPPGSNAFSSGEIWAAKPR